MRQGSWDETVPAMMLWSGAHGLAMDPELFATPRQWDIGFATATIMSPSLKREHEYDSWLGRMMIQLCLLHIVVLYRLAPQLCLLAR